jgi:hypothetical protein
MLDSLAIVREGLGWLHVLVALAGAAVCAAHVSRSRWLWVLLGGFATDAAVSASYRLVTLFLGRGLLASAHLEGVFLVTSLVGLAAWGAIVLGLAGVLSETRRASSLASTA